MPPSGAVIREWTVADVLARFGPIAVPRLRHAPTPGQATEQDVLDIYSREKRLYELSDGVLVEKILGTQEAFLSWRLGGFLYAFDPQQRHGFALGADGMARLFAGCVRIPDLSFITWRQVPGGKGPRTAMLDFAPELAVEVLSPGNTLEEMDAKLKDYFRAGYRLVWYVDAARRTVQVFTAVEQSTLLREGDTLTGDPVLPGFRLALQELFARLEP